MVLWMSFRAGIYMEEANICKLQVAMAEMEGVPVSYRLSGRSIVDIMMLSVVASQCANHSFH
jgi:hypothetical protein